MKFEIPKINIEMFNTENIITTSGVSSGYTEQINAVNAQTKSKMNAGETNIFTFSF